MKTALAAWIVALPLIACGAVEGDDGAAPAAEEESAAATATAATVGRSLFFDANLSQPAGQSCATCHVPGAAFSDSRGTPTSQGAVAGYFGARNTPSITYASYIPGLGAAGDEAGYAGGLFWDGRAASLEIQAEGPLLNPIEMGNPDRAAVVAKVKGSSYASSFKRVFGSSVFNDTDLAFTAVTKALAAYQRTGISGRFTSKYDAYLARRVSLSAAEARGLALFEAPRSGGCLTLPTGSQLCGCAQCHLTRPAADGTPPLFSDWGFDNLGIPKNPASRYYTMPLSVNPDGASYVDHGLSASLHNPRQDGKFRAPTLRNIARTAPYGHNGSFADLASVVRFYNNRDVAGAGWSAPEVNVGLNTANMGNLGLSAQEQADLVSFMLTLTDGYTTSAAR